MNDPLVGRVLAERFEVQERIGEGGTGVVYKAKQLSVDRTIAIKVLGAHVSTDPSWVKRFHNEARAASRLDHPNTVRLIDFGQTKEGLLFIAMEFLHGRSLRSEIDQHKRLQASRVLRIMSQICASLSEAHNQGIIHRDIKPDNVYLVDMKGTEDFVKVLDFSVAKLDTPDAQVTRAGVVFGTPAYMSPEQGRGVQLDARSDIYAVGIVAYEMLTGRPPFDHQIPTEVVMMHLRDAPAPLVGVPPALAELVMRALEKDPARRQQTAEQLDNECQGVLAGLGGASGRMITPAPMPAMSAPPSRSATSSAVAQQQTMMAPATQAPVHSSQANTMMIDHNTPRPQQQGGRTLALDASGQPAPQAAARGGGATMMLPESKGVVAFARDQALAARQVAQEQALPAAAPAAGVMFWLAWVLLGLGLGLGYHLFIARAAG